MRYAAVLVLAVVAGCFQRPHGDAFAGDDDTRGKTTCVDDGDCVGAGPSCCACPEYAVAADSDWATACQDVQCPDPGHTTCSGAVPRCGDDGHCTLGCPVVACDQTCTTGFAVDVAGCLTCECAPGPLDVECTADDQCVRVPADCCGCVAGGMDTAIPVDQIGSHDADLGCSSTPVCPGVDVCTPGLVARCDELTGRCVLDTGVTATPPGSCGTPDLPPCPPGQTCVLNSDGGATMQGVGICQ